MFQTDDSSYTPSFKPEYQTHPDIDQTAYMDALNTTSLRVQSSCGWTLGIWEHVEDTIIKLKINVKKFAFCWFLLHRYITMYGSKITKIPTNLVHFIT